MGTRRSGAALIACVALYSIVLGGAYAALAVDLAARGFGARDVAINAAMTPLGLFVAALVLPRLIRGAVFPWLVAAVAATVLVMLGLAFTRSYAAWLVLRFVLGLSANALFVVAESALMIAIPERSSGSFLSMYNGVVTGGYALGPLILALAPMSTPAALAAGGAVVALSAVPLAMGVPRRALALPPLEVGSGLVAFALAAPALVVGSAAVAIFDNAALALFPVSVMETGHGRDVALVLLAALLAGATLLQWPIGAIADRWSSLGMLRACAAATVACCTALPVVAHAPAALGVLGFVAGGTAFGTYSMVLALVKERFASSALVTANAALGVTWGLGALVGVPAVGTGMDAAGPLLFGPLAALPFLVLLAASLAPIAGRAAEARGGRSH
ncbi:MFS transporter [Salinarimonas rosea]|uniref:MFS transporter n=1 Tax=Salinarimonas rosea TaxID=552063 RepID=UPI00040C8B97|nr:MFS transporter [Salinarimonas rosea]